MIGLIQHTLLHMLDNCGVAGARAEVLRRVGLPEDKHFRIDTDYDDLQAAERRLAPQRWAGMAT